MVKVRGPLFSLLAWGWLGTDVYKRRKVNYHPYPLALLGRIHIPYPIPAFGLRPYGPFISQYYSVTGWIYERRRTWHGIQPVVRRAAFNPNPNKTQQILAQDRLREAVAIWKSMDEQTKNVYNRMKYPKILPGYHRFIRKYLRNQTYMPVYWGTLERSGLDSSKIEDVFVNKNLPEINYSFNFRNYQLFNAVIHKGDGFPDSPETGQVFFNTNTNRLYYYSNGSWYELKSSLTPWITRQETWQFNTTTSVKTAGYVLSDFRIGQRIRIYQYYYGYYMWKYFYLVGTDYSGGYTILNLKGGIYDTVDNSTIYSLEVSDDLRPTGFSLWKTHSTNPTGFSGTPSDSSRFALIGNLCFFQISVSGTSNANTFTLTAPLPSASDYISNHVAYGKVVDNGNTLAHGEATIGSGTSTVTISTQFISNNFTASGTKGAYILLIYPYET